MPPGRATSRRAAVRRACFSPPSPRPASRRRGRSGERSDGARRQQQPPSLRRGPRPRRSPRRRPGNGRRASSRWPERLSPWRSAGTSSAPRGRAPRERASRVGRRGCRGGARCRGRRRGCTRGGEPVLARDRVAVGRHVPPEDPVGPVGQRHGLHHRGTGDLDGSRGHVTTRVVADLDAQAGTEPGERRLGEGERHAVERSGHGGVGRGVARHQGRVRRRRGHPDGQGRRDEQHEGDDRP